MRGERERIGLSQVDFATLGGAKKHSQINYEANRTAPDSNYLSALMQHGVDVLYLFTGTRHSALGASEPPLDPAALRAALEFVQEFELSYDLELDAARKTELTVSAYAVLRVGNTAEARASLSREFRVIQGGRA